jgi:hypothetical protein
MQLVDLDTITRRHMIEEINNDISRHALYMSPRLSERGLSDYTGLLLEAAESGDSASLAEKLRSSGRLKITRKRLVMGNQSRSECQAMPLIRLRKENSIASTLGPSALEL